MNKEQQQGSQNPVAEKDPKEEQKKNGRDGALQENNDDQDIGKSKKEIKSEQREDDQKNLVLGVDRKLWYIFIWELIGTFIFAWGINASQGNDFFISASLFGAIILTANFTGGHVNPAVSTAFYCLRIKKLSISTQEYITYMVAQFTGAFLGGFIAWGVLKDINSPYPADETAFWVFRDILGEIFGTFTFILIILIMVNLKTTFARKYPLFQILTICAGLTFSRSFTYHSGGVLNPGIALGLQFFRSLANFDFTPMVHAYIYILGPFIGAICAALFYERTYIPFLKPKPKNEKPASSAVIN